jgi:hypothetical protein
VSQDMSNPSELTIAELASFCIQKPAHLEARFIILCHRARAAGIECSDLWEQQLPRGSEDGPPLQLLN